MATLDDLLRDAALALRPVVDERRSTPVRWVATSELTDPSPYLEGGEVLLTTGLETATWRRQWDPYVRRLARAGVVAVGLAVGLTHESSPNGLVRACRKHEVDLFEVPRRTAFVAVSHRLADLLQREQESAERAALASQRALVQAALREDEPSALLEEVGRIGDLAAVVGADGALLAGPVGPRTSELDVELVAEAVARMRPRGLRAATAVSGPGGTLLVHPLGVRGRPGRYLVTGFTGRPSELQRGTVTTAVALMSLAEVRMLGRRDADRRLRARAVELLLAGDRRTASVLLGATESPRRRLPRQPAVLRARGSRRRMDAGLDVAEEAGALAGLLEREGTTELAVVTGETRRLADRLARLGLRVGIGGDDETAGHALELATPTTPVVAWADTVGQGVLSLLDGRRAAAFAAAYLAPLADAEAAESGGPVLTETLAAYLRQHGSLLKTAAELGVHRNTVRNRVERIEQLLDCSLENPQARVDAWVALQARVSEARR